jgi:hypothetical protein
MYKRPTAIVTTPNGKYSFAPVSLNNAKPSLISHSYYCWVEGTNAPTQTHATESEAKAEAARLATSNPGKRVHVMINSFDSVASVTATGVKWE